MSEYRVAILESALLEGLKESRFESLADCRDWASAVTSYYDVTSSSYEREDEEGETLQDILTHVAWGYTKYRFTRGLEAAAQWLDKAIEEKE